MTHRAAGSRTSVRPSGSVRGIAKRCSASSTGVTIGIGLEGLGCCGRDWGGASMRQAACQGGRMAVTVSSTGVTIEIGLEGLFVRIEAYTSCAEVQRCWLLYWSTRQAHKQPI